MVIAGRAAGIARSVWSHLSADVGEFWAAMARQDPLAPGLYHYELYPQGGRRSVYLRAQRDGSAVLFVDVTDAIHLNPSAALLAKAALDGLPKPLAIKRIRRRFAGCAADVVASDADAVYSIVRHLATTADSCPTCGLRNVQFTPPFSAPVAAPYKADLALTYGCNNACGHCYNEVRSASRGVYPLGWERGTISTLSQISRGDKPLGSLAESGWRQVLQKVADIGIPHVIFTGGEPTMVPWLFDLICEAVRQGLIAGLNTNGRRLAEPGYGARLKSAGLDHVQITLESSRPAVHNAMTAADSFSETIAGIRRSLSAGLHTITNTTLTRQNVDHALEIADFVHGLGLKAFAMNGMIFSGRGRNNRDALSTEGLTGVLRSVRNRAAELGMRFLWYTPTRYCRLSPLELELGPRRCNAGEYSLCIEPNGDVLPCQSYYVAAGNILRDPWPTIWQSALFRGFRDRVKEPQATGLPAECSTCLDLPVCGGGCRLERETP
jgi:radical SAM protein with 4Fe4S-binding SPASM domain